jgi:hypothetical protein
MSINIVNLTPHPVTIYRTHPADTGAPADREPLPPVTYPACAPADLPRAIETPMTGAGCMQLAVSGDTQDAYENHWSMVHTGVVDFAGYSGVENLPDLSPAGYSGVDNLPDLSPEERAFGCTTFRIVSIVTAIGAIAAGRPIVDLLIPMGQVRDTSGRIIGATALAPASGLLTPMAEKILAMRQGTIDALIAQRDQAQQLVADLTRVREAQDATIMEQQAEIVRLSQRDQSLAYIERVTAAVNAGRRIADTDESTEPRRSATPDADRPIGGES